MIGLAKQTLFGKRQGHWPNLEKLVETKALLNTDLAYAKRHVKTEKDAAFYCALLYLARKGHLCLSQESLQELPPKLQELLPPIEAPLYLPKYEEVEIEIALHIKRLLSYSKSTAKIPKNPEATDEQNCSIANALTYNLSLITGGPGTGKTYTATQIATTFPKKRIYVAAPTGKAASHLEAKLQNPSIQASTLHSLLKIRRPIDFSKPIEELDADLLIVDECSMIDPILFARLLASIGPNTTLILMGDSHQLSAVEGGSLFADLIATKKIPTTTLTKCMRSDRVEILDLAHSILKGSAKDLRTIDLGFAENSIETIYQKLWHYAKKHFPRDFTKNIDAFRILTTLKKGPLGSDALNAYLFEKFETLTDQYPIMITTNDPKTGLCNGEMGILYKNNQAIFSENREFALQELPSYTYAYCITVHKSQGSEYDHVLFLIPEGSSAFGKEVLYTAATRARNKLDIEGDLQQIQSALSKSSKKISGIKNVLS